MSDQHTSGNAIASTAAGTIASDSVTEGSSEGFDKSAVKSLIVERIRREIEKKDGPRRTSFFFKSDPPNS